MYAEGFEAQLSEAWVRSVHCAAQAGKVGGPGSEVAVCAVERARWARTATMADIRGEGISCKVEV